MILWSRVNELRDEVGADDFGEVVELFLEEVSEVMARLDEPGGRSGLAANLHFLKGSALSLGFTAFAGLCQQGERLASNDQADLVDLAAIMSCFDRSRAAFLAGLASEAAA